VRTGGEDGALAGRISYDDAARTTTFTSALGEVTTYRIDEYGHVAEVIDPLGHRTVSEHDRFGRLLSRTDATGATTRIRRNENGDAIEMERADASVMSANYNHFRQPMALTDPDGGRWEYTYDDRGNLTSVTDPVGAVTRHVYTDKGFPTQIINALGHSSVIETNAAGLTTAVTAADGARWSLVRDARGRVPSTADPLGSTTATAYDGEGRPVSTTYPDGSVESWEYDAAGNLLMHTDPAGNRTGYEVGPFRLVTARIDPDGTRTLFAHDSQLRITAVTNPAGLVWSYTYDPAGNLVGETDFNGRSQAYRYDDAGRIVERVNGAGQHIELVRDELGRVVEQRVDGESAATFAYDPNGRLIHARNHRVELDLVRDRAGRLVAERFNGRAVTMSYDALGQCLSRTTPSSRVSTWQYDPAGTPLVLDTGDGIPIAFGHDASGRETYRWVGSRTAITQDWDSLERVNARRLVVVDGSGESAVSRLVQERSWTYRPDDAPTSVTDSVSGTLNLNLDPFGRVTEVSAATWTAVYAYDPSGNLAGAVDSRTEATPTSGVRAHSGTLLHTAGRTRYEYDGQGRMVKMTQRTLSGATKDWSYTYDAFDRLTEAVTPGGAHWHYDYDPLGRRVSKQRLSSDGTVVEEYRFAWEDTVLAEQEHLVTGRSERAVTSWDYLPGTYTPVAQHSHTTLVDEPQEVIDRKFHAIVTDLIGTPTELVTPDGQIVWRRNADVWGGPLLTVGSSGPAQDDPGCPLRFPGQYHDAETGLHYNYQRYYDPATARYTSPDPLGLEPAPNHHAYVSNPLSRLDPLGLKDFLSDAGRARLRAVAARHGGIELPDGEHGIGNFQFPSRRAARQAASEIAGDLGSTPRPFRVEDYKGAPKMIKSKQINPKSIMGMNNGKPSVKKENHGTAGWRDDEWGHSYSDGDKVGPHVNAWNDAAGIGNSHLYYPCE
jgi:RHS repeat-associated protein